MNVGAVIAFVLDVRERRTTLATLQQPHMGFQELPGGVWTWRCVQEPLARAVAAPAGSAMHLASVLGLPFVRLRAALPECAFAGSVGQALGRREGLSVNGLNDAREENVAVMTALAQALSCCGLARERIPPFEAERLEAGDGKLADESGVATVTANAPLHATLLHAPSQSSPQRSLQPHPVYDGEPDEAAEQLVGTALVFAFMANAKTLSVVDYAQRLQAASTHFRGTTLRGIDHGFDELHGMLTVMLSEGNLSGRTDWLEKSRLWRFILLQRADGAWDLSQAIAFALQAHEGARPPPKPPLSKLRTLLGVLLGDDDLEDALDDAVANAMTSSDEEDDAAATEAAGAGGELPAPPLRHAKDCPLTFTRAAIKRRLPAALAALNDEYYASLEEDRQALQIQEAEAERARARLAAATAAMEEAAAVALQAQDGAVLQQNAFSALHALLTSAAAKLQQELDALRSIASTVPPGPHKQRMQTLECSVSRRLEHLSSRFDLPLAPAASPATTVAITTAASSMRLPPSASTLGAASSGGGSRRRRARLRERVPVERIWATVLALNVLEELDSCWQADEEDDTMATIVDRGREFLKAESRTNRRLRKLLKSGALDAAAERARREWKAIQAHNVALLRETEVINKFTALTHVQRASARVVRSMMTDHSTFATFLDTEGYIMRWQRFSARPNAFVAARLALFC